MHHDEHPTPTGIRLSQKSKALEIDRDNGSHFSLPCEYLTVYSPSADAFAVTYPHIIIFV